jgi:hypothetical protein
VTDLTAVDVLLVPDEATIARAKAINATLRDGLPSGFALDETHQAHVTMLQRYVRSVDLEGVYEAVDSAIAARHLATLRLHAVGLLGGEFGTPPGTMLASIDIEPTPALRALQEALVEALRPFTESHGAPDAFFTTADEPTVNAVTIAYVEGFVPARSGARYAPHLTVGVGLEEVVRGLEARPFADFEFDPSAVGVYRLGNFGAARQVLRSWPLRPA